LIVKGDLGGLAILEKEVHIGISTNVKHYEDLGYKIHREKDINGKLRVPSGTKLRVKVEDITYGSKIKLTKVCDDCGKLVPNQQYKGIVKGRKNGDGRDRCGKCALSKEGEIRKNNIQYENSLEYFAKHNNKGYLLKEFSNKNLKKTNEISRGTSDKYWWNCDECRSEYDMDVVKRTGSGIGCPYCSGHRVNHTNCLATKYPELASEWHPSKNKQTSKEVTSSSRKKVWWKCNEGHEWEAKVQNRTYYGSGCPICNESKGEKRIRNWLIKKQIYFIDQKEFKDLVGVAGGSLTYDFNLPIHNMLIEYQGEQHERPVDFLSLGLKSAERKFIIQQEHDRRKREYAKQNNIELLEIWYSDFDNIEKILERKLNKWIPQNLFKKEGYKYLK
jgi:hypothetical protein